MAPIPGSAFCIYSDNGVYFPSGDKGHIARVAFSVIFVVSFDMSTVLKAKHSLKGKNLLPLAVQLKGVEQPRSLARFEKTVDTENMELVDLKERLVGLMGDNPDEIVNLSGRGGGIQVYRLV